jgi:hypothetical protein
MTDRKPELVTTFENFIHSGIQRAALIDLALPSGACVPKP